MTQVVASNTNNIVKVYSVGVQGTPGAPGPSGSLQSSNSGSFTITGSLIVSGSNTFTNIGPAIFSGSVTSTSGFTGSLAGTASYASFALTASYAVSASYEIIKEESSSYADTASIAILAYTASYINPTFISASAAASGFGVITSTGSLMTTGSVLGNVLTFTKGNGSTFNLTVNTGSSGTTPTLAQVTAQGSTTSTGVTFTSSGVNSLQIVNLGTDIPFISVSGSVTGPTPGRLIDVVYSAISVTTNATTTIAELPAPKVAGFTFDYIAYAGSSVLQAGRAGVVKGILRNTSGGSITKGFQLTETTTLDLTDQGYGTAGLQFNIVQDTNGISNQLVAITDGIWNYTINYTLTTYYNPANS